MRRVMAMAMGRRWRVLGFIVVLAALVPTVVLYQATNAHSAHRATPAGATPLPAPLATVVPQAPTPTPNGTHAPVAPTPTPNPAASPAAGAPTHVATPAPTAAPAPVATHGPHPMDVPGGWWVAPANGATVNDNVTIEAEAYPTNPGDPPIWFVNFTGWYNGSWNVICTVYQPSYSDVYECPWHLAGVVQPGWVTISFDVYDTSGQVNYSPNGEHSIEYVPPPPGGWWVAPANGAHVNDNVTIEAQAYPTNAGDPAINYVNFTGWYNGQWNVICTVYAPSYSDVYECPWHLAGVVQPGWVTISFDVYDVIGHVNYAPNGTHSIDYAPPPPGGWWVAPANGAHVNDKLTIEAKAYPTNAGDPAISHVNFTGWYNGQWNVICTVYQPTYSDVYECPWYLAGVVQPGSVTISFDVYNTAGQVHYAPNGEHSIDYVPPLPGGWWVAPANGAHVGNGTVLQAEGYPINAGDPAISHVNFTSWYNGQWNVICTAYQPTYSNVYECPWLLKGVISPGYVTVSFDVYNTAGQVHYAPNGEHSIDYVPGAAKAMTAIAWAMLQIGSTTWNGRCEVFVEQAYNDTTEHFTTAQAAYTALHTSTSWSPDIGALVWFAPNAGNQQDGHVGIYIGQGLFISATETSGGVQIESMSSWSSNVAPYEGWGDAPASWPGM